MSFGFSVGDIVLITQLSYRLYDTLATDNGLAAKELGNALFSLRCALDHLGRQATEISLQTSHDEDQNADRMHKDLDTMIASCAATLTELEKEFAKYASADQVNSTPGSRVQTGAELGTRDKLQLSLSRLKKPFKIGSMRIRWSKDSQLFTEYREKLQSHADAINMVVTTFLWSASQRIENASKVNAEKVQQIRDQARQSDAELLRLLNGIHAAVLKPSQNIIVPKPMMFNNPNQKAAPDAGYQGLSVQPYFAGSNPAGLPTFPKPSPSNSTLMPQHGEAVAPQLSPDLLEINKSRSAIGLEQFVRFRRQNRIPVAVPRPEPETDPNSFFGVQHPTVPQVAAELEKIVFNMSSRSKSTSTSSDIVTQRLHRWLQGFEAIVQSWPTKSAGTKADKQRRQEDGHALMLNLNSKISQANGPVRTQIYEALDDGGIERIFEKLRESLRSLAVEKEIDIYEDERGSF